ncbi:hypothetical protein DFA_05107 [Cavenderia fasciculata]|uniref:Uncharacterized protein n=1 Tax=Cavenderia fasciculata TaxID=261658 RepID=F4PNC4_CACFS|nr:uncharacterized protein DFA_05107 [Cavenderia fasciculata]EGG22977.1 hypothetical protein DFA_05107 [Cavenderia fasciculata]|eukprot:XP_004360828.1 hypothetical protein DFA_05107 [Cavenderia fasciculata]
MVPKDECVRRRADQVILDITYKLCNIADPHKDDDLIYDKDNIHPSTALIQLLFIQLPYGTDNDKCLFHHLSYETKKHMHEIILEHIKQSKEFVHHEMELIQLMISNQYGIIRLHNYDAHIRDKYLDVIYDTLDTIFRVYKDPNISKSSIKTIFLDAHNDGYFVPQLIEYMNVFDTEDFNDIKVISETLKEDNELVQRELLKFIKQFCNMPYYLDMFVDSIEFRDIIKETFNHIINQASPYSHLLSSLVKVCDQDRRNRNQFASLILERIFPTEPLWQECIVNLVLKSIQSNHRKVLVSAISLVRSFSDYHIPQFPSLKALSKATIALLDRFQNDDDILYRASELFHLTIVQLGFKEINQFIQRILFSKQYKHHQIDNFVGRYLVKWIARSEMNLSIYLPRAMKIIIIGQPINSWVSTLSYLFKRPHKATTNQYIQHLITPLIQLHSSQSPYTHTTEKAKASKLLSLLYTRTVEYKGIHHQESTLLFQQILDSLAEAMPYDLSQANPDVLELLRYHLAAATKMVEQIILGEGNITTDQILQIIDLIVQAQHYTISTYRLFRWSWDELPEIDILVKTLVSMDGQLNTIEMISFYVIGRVIDWINQNMGSTKSDLSSKVELVIDFYDELNIFPLSITMSPTEEISYSEWIDLLIVALEKNTRYSPRDLTKELKQIKKK